MERQGRRGERGRRRSGSSRARERAGRCCGRECACSAVLESRPPKRADAKETKGADSKRHERVAAPRIAPTSAHRDRHHNSLALCSVEPAQMLSARRGASACRARSERGRRMQRVGKCKLCSACGVCAVAACAGIALRQSKTPNACGEIACAACVRACAAPRAIQHRAPHARVRHAG
eukprot:4293910-Pleurochrysis_carterae.AAC.2